MPVTLDAIMKINKMLTKNVNERLILVRESKIFFIQHIVQVRNKILVSFETRNLCNFLLCLFRSIISSLVNYYYLMSFSFQSVSFKHMYQILYFIFHRYKLLSMPPIFSAIHVRSAIGDSSTIFRS